MEKKELIEICESIMKDLQKRVNNRSKYGEDWDVSHDTICNNKYEISISIHDCDNFSMYLGKKPYFIFRLMEDETCMFVVEEKDFEVFISKVLEIVK